MSFQAVRTEADLRAWVASARETGAYHPGFEALLRETHPVYDGRGSAAVIRMRGWLLASLAVLTDDTPLPDTALPFVLEELESGHDPYLTAAAARALRRAAPREDYVSALLSGLFYLRHRDDAVSLEEYGGYGPIGGTRASDGEGDERTTAVTEVLATLAHLGAAARDALPRLREMRAEPQIGPGLAGRLDATIESIESIESREPAAPTPAPASSCCCSGKAATPAPTPDPRLRPELTPDDVAAVRLQDQDGETLRFGDLFRGRPSIVAFFYTRCDNPTKCALTMTRLGRVQRLLRREGLEDAVTVAAVTYDPAFDLPPRLARYAATWGFEPGGRHKVLRTVDDFSTVERFFDLGVNYVGSAGTSVVNRHRIEAFVLDASGRIASSATRRRWDAETLVREARSLLPPSSAP